MYYSLLEVKKIPLGPPLPKGEDEWFVSEILPLVPPFRKLVFTHNQGCWTQGVLEDVAGREQTLLSTWQ